MSTTFLCTKKSKNVQQSELYLCIWKIPWKRLRAMSFCQLFQLLKLSHIFRFGAVTIAYTQTTETEHMPVFLCPSTLCYSLISEFISSFFSFRLMLILLRLFSLHLIDFIYSSVQFGAHNRLRRDCSPLSITLINSNRFHWWHIVCCLILHLERNKWNKRNIKVKWNENGGKKKQNSREQTLTNDPKRNFQRA